MMRKLTLAAFAALTPVALTAQNGASVSRQTSSGDGREMTFTHQMASGDRLEIENVNGAVVATRARGRTAEITVTKTVKRGNGDNVKAIMEVENGIVRVCTIYTDRRDSCRDNDHNNNSRGDDHDRSEVEMAYEVHVPAGVELSADNVNGDINVSGLDAPATLDAVNGTITFDGASASKLNTVNGRIRATFDDGDWDGTLKVASVNGNIDLTFPSNLSATIKGETVNGSVSSPDFPITIDGKWGPKSFNGRIGRGGPALAISTVNGNIALHAAGRARNSNRDSSDDDERTTPPTRRGRGGGGE